MYFVVVVICFLISVYIWWWMLWFWLYIFLMSIYYWLYVLLQAPFLSINLAGCSGMSCVNNADWEGCDFSFFLLTFLFCSCMVYLSSPGATWAGGWWRSQRWSRIPIGLSKKNCLLSLFSFSTSFWYTCFLIVFNLVAPRFPLNDAGRAIVATLAARILEDPQGPGFIRWTWPPVGMVGRLGIDTKSCLFTS